jgi:hypothetical protein
VDVDNAYRLGAKERALAARLDKLTLRRKQVLAWLRRTIVSIGIGGASYDFMLGIMVLSVVYDREFEPVITFAFDAGVQYSTHWIGWYRETIGDRWQSIISASELT